MPFPAVAENRYAFGPPGCQAALPTNPKTIANLISKGWVERAEDGAAYRLTALGLEAKKAPVKVG